MTTDQCIPLPWVGSRRAGIVCSCGGWSSGPRDDADIKPDKTDGFTYTLKAAWDLYRKQHWEPLHPGRPLPQKPRQRRHDPLQSERLFMPE